MLGMMLIKSLTENKQISGEERRRFVEIIENGDRQLKDDKVLIANLKAEYSRTKIEGKYDVPTTLTYFSLESRSRLNDSRSRFDRVS